MPSYFLPGPKDDKGVILIALLFMLVLLLSSILICGFQMGEELNLDVHHQETMERMQGVRRALFGKIADIPKGTEIINCGGLMSDYARMVRYKDFPKWVLERPENAVEWHYNKEYHFWAGWRGPYYIPSPGEKLMDDNGDLAIMDGWGHPIEASILCKFSMLFAYGKDKKPTFYGRDYDRDIKNIYTSRIKPGELTFVRVRVNNRTDHFAKLIIEVVYPFRGELKEAHSIALINARESKDVYVVPYSTPISCGVRKVSVLDLKTREVKASKAFGIWYAGGVSEIIGETEIDYEG